MRFVRNIFTVGVIFLQLISSLRKEPNVVLEGVPKKVNGDQETHRRQRDDN